MHTTTTKVEVRYGETDQMGVVYHANYLVWLELGRTALVESLGLSYVEMEEAGTISPIVEVNIKYKMPLHYGEVATIKTWIEKYDGLRVVYGYEILNPRGEICATANTTNVCAKKNTFRLISMRRSHPDWHRIYQEASQK